MLGVIWKTPGRAALFLSAVLSATSAAAATVSRSIEVDPQHRSDAVLITEVDVGPSSIQCGIVIGPREVQPVTPFPADDDWLKDTRIVLLNRTNKTIAFGQVTLAFPETGTGATASPQKVFTIHLGRLPANVVAVRQGGQPAPQSAPLHSSLSFGPGERITLRLADYTDQLRAAMDGIPLTALTKCRIHLGSFIFDDGLRWDGTYSLPDPDHPGKFKAMDGRYFPGTPTWPPKAQQ